MASPLYLTLLAGPVEAFPVPKPVIDAFVSAEITESASEPSGFQLTFTLADDSILQTLLLLAGDSPIPVLRVILVVTFAGLPQVVMDGVIEHHEVVPDATSGSSKLVVSGRDLSVLMDLIPFTGLPYPGTTPDARAAVILAKYAALGVVPEIVPALVPDIPVPVERIPVQHGTDLAYLKEIAEDVGYVFYLTPGLLPGTTQAYWGPQVRIGIPQPALPPVTPFNPPLGLAVPVPQKVTYPGDTANMTPAEALMRGIAEAVEHADVVTGNGTLNVDRYGQILRARSLVGVRGAGLAFDGMYYVDSCTHNLKPGEYKQSFVLKRNALISNLPVVPALPY